MGLVEKMKAELERYNHSKQWEKKLLEKIEAVYGQEVAKKIIQELKPTRKGSTYHTYVLRINMVYQLLSEGTTLEDAIARAKKY